MADGNVINAVKNIICSDAGRRYIVVSAPGKRFSGDKKVTDLLYACHAAHGTEKEGAFAPVRARFESIARELNCGLAVKAVLDETEREIFENADADFTASRGEYLCARIAAEVFGAKFCDARDVIFFGADGGVDSERTYKAVKEVCSKYDFVVFPGFYGTGSDGKIKTFSRGGSDITGALIARAIRASVYENWTDVSGFYACDPRIVASPRHIKSLSYEEMGELSFMGAGVLHSQSVLPVREAGIPVIIKNTFRPQDEGTVILPVSDYLPGNGPVTGISGNKNYTAVVLYKASAETDPSFLRRALEICGRRAAAERTAGYAGSLSLAFRNLPDDVTGEISSFLEEELQPDSVRVIKNLSYVSVVGYGLGSSCALPQKIFSALAAAGIEVYSAEYGANRLSFTVSVRDGDFENCIKTLYSEFFN